MSIFQLTSKMFGINTSGHLRPMVDRTHGDIKVIRVEVLDGGSFTLSLIDVIPTCIQWYHSHMTGSDLRPTFHL